VNNYGTPSDGEYADFPRPFPRDALPMLAVRSLIVPALFIGRFTVGTLSVVHPPTREKFERRLSQFHMDMSRKTDEWTVAERTRWLPYEFAVLSWYLAGFVLLVTGIVPLWFFVFFYLRLAGGLFINHVRFLLAHGYRLSEEPRSFEDQIADSYDRPSTLGFLWAPIGHMYHATHHWFPRMPYHALGRAHRRIAADPDLAPVIARSTVRAGLAESLREFLDKPAQSEQTD
jgi:fatty acid desaturase